MTSLQSLLVELRVHARLSHSVRASCHRSAVIATGLFILACARSGLDPGDLALAGEPVPVPTSTGRGGAGGAACVPQTEACNGADDDCNGSIDDLPALACPGGGYSYCVGGHQSACPSRCELCIPGSERVCFTSYCTFWGTQTCTADGRSFGLCRERRVPNECEDAAGRDGEIAKLERCCIDHGYCCVDSQDLDHDGDRNEVLGRCEDVSCN